MKDNSGPFPVPAWLEEAWMTGRNQRYWTDDQIIATVKRLRTELRDNKVASTAANFDLWHMYSLLAVLGWREVRRVLDSESETDRVEDSDQPS